MTLWCLSIFNKRRFYSIIYIILHCIYVPRHSIGVMFFRTIPTDKLLARNSDSLYDNFLISVILRDCSMFPKVIEMECYHYSFCPRGGQTPLSTSVGAMAGFPLYPSLPPETMKHFPALAEIF